MGLIIHIIFGSIVIGLMVGIALILGLPATHGLLLATGFIFGRILRHLAPRKPQAQPA